MITERLLAHRGYPALYPENSLIGIQAAIDCGATAIEFDIQLSADQIPVLFHDAKLKRVTGQAGKVMEQQWHDLQNISNGEADRLDDQFPHSCICSLADAVSLFANHPSVTAFVEIKKHSLKHFGVENAMDKVLKEIEAILPQCVIISYHEEALHYTRSVSEVKIGWIIKDYDLASLTIAANLKPEFLVCNMEKIPEKTSPLWEGNWAWVLYETSNPVIAQKWLNHGADFVETDAIGSMIKAIAE